MKKQSNKKTAWLKKDAWIEEGTQTWNLTTEKLVALVVEPVKKDFNFVSYYELYEVYQKGKPVGLKHLVGLTVLTSLEDVFYIAWKKKLQIIPKNIFDEKKSTKK